TGILPRGHLAIDLGRGGPGLVVEHLVEGMDVGLVGLDHGEVGLDHVEGGHVALAHGRGDGGGRRRQLAHGSSPRIGGTRKRPSSTAGATASTSPRSTHGATSSGRSTLTSGNGCDIGGTSPTSSASTSCACSSTAASCEVNRSSSSTVRLRRASW